MLNSAHRHGSGWDTVESTAVLYKLTTCCFFDICNNIDIPMCEILSSHWPGLYRILV